MNKSYVSFAKLIRDLENESRPESKGLSGQTASQKSNSETNQAIPDTAQLLASLMQVFLSVIPAGKKGFPEEKPFTSSDAARIQQLEGELDIHQSALRAIDHKIELKRLQDEELVLKGGEVL